MITVTSPAHCIDEVLQSLGSWWELRKREGGNEVPRVGCDNNQGEEEPRTHQQTRRRTSY